MPSVSLVKRTLSPCLKEQSSDRVGEVLVIIQIFIGSERLFLRVQERSACERAVAQTGPAATQTGKSRAKVLEPDLAAKNREAPFPGLLQ
jgi:hypothetical protein